LIPSPESCFIRRRGYLTNVHKKNKSEKKKKSLRGSFTPIRWEGIKKKRKRKKRRKKGDPLTPFADVRITPTVELLHETTRKGKRKKGSTSKREKEKKRVHRGNECHLFYNRLHRNRDIDSAMGKGREETSEKKKRGGKREARLPTNPSNLFPARGPCLPLWKKERRLRGKKKENARIGAVDCQHVNQPSASAHSRRERKRKKGGATREKRRGGGQRIDSSTTVYLITFCSGSRRLKRKKIRKERERKARLR